MEAVSPSVEEEMSLLACNYLYINKLREFLCGIDAGFSRGLFTEISRSNVHIFNFAMATRTLYNPDAWLT